MPRPHLHFEAPEHFVFEKSSDWHYAFWVIAVACAVAAVILDNVIFGIFILVSAFALALHDSQEPKLIKYEFNNRGIISHKTFYNYETLESFGIDTHSELAPKLILKSKKFFMPYIIIPLWTTDMHEIKDFLLDHLPEDDHKEPLGLKIAEYLGF